jgi:hypothetical protein
VAEWLGADSDRAGRVKVQEDLSVPGHPNIFFIGDAAAATGPDGKPLPGVAPVAKQQGQYVANLLMARAQGRTLPGFRYRDFGSMATIGRKRTVAQIGTFKVSGLVAWLLWSFAHIYFFNRLPQSSGGRDELVLELRALSARYPIDYRHFRLTHRRRDARRDGRRSSAPHPIWKENPSSAEPAACVKWRILIKSIGKELPSGWPLCCGHHPLLGALE